MHESKRRGCLLVWMLILAVCFGMCTTALAADAEELQMEPALELPLASGDGSMDKSDAVQRGQFVAMLYELAGSPAVEASLPFLDMEDQSEEVWNAVAWAYAQGYINGRSETCFDPSGTLTRQEAAKILFYCAGGVSGMELLFMSLYDNGFEDSAEIADWAKAPMYWAYFNVIITCPEPHALKPTAVVTLEQAEAMLNSYLEYT